MAASGSSSDQAYDVVRTMILDLDLKPGDPLSEKSLGESIGLSRTPVREALHRLERDGLVRLVPGRGAFVSEISIPDVVELFQMREALEAQAARLATRNGQPGELRGLRAALQEHAADEILAGNLGWYYEHTVRLDQVILELSGNSRLAESLKTTWTQIRRVRRLSGESISRLIASIDEHVKIVDAVLAGDEGAADAATRMHVRESLRYILEAVRGSL